MDLVVLMFLIEYAVEDWPHFYDLTASWLTVYDEFSALKGGGVPLLSLLSGDSLSDSSPEYIAEPS
jgi:hypothetical protein